MNATVNTIDQLDQAFRQMKDLCAAISLLGEAETTPPHVMSGLADIGVAISKDALELLHTIPTRPGQTEYTSNAAPN